MSMAVLGPAQAEDDQCAPKDVFVLQPLGTDRVVKIEDWSVTKKDEDTKVITLVIGLKSGKAIRMIDGTVSFYDALDGNLGSLAIDRDAHIGPDKPFKQVDRYGRFAFDRLPNLKHEEVRLLACVKAVVYEDGTKETFK